MPACGRQGARPRRKEAHPMEAVLGRQLSRREILKEWWQEIKENREEDFWANTRTYIKRLLKELMESTMIEELRACTCSEWHERNEERIDYRNGFRYRRFLTHEGPIEDLKVPRLREGKFKTKVFKNYQARQEAVDQAIKDVFICGVSTRRVGEALSALLDAPVSAGTVSNVTKALDKEVKKFHRQKLTDEHQYLILDGIHLKIKGVLKGKKKVILVAYGITMMGQRKLIGFRVVGVESEAKWEQFLTDLYNRGLIGKELKLITTDGCKGLHKALDIVYPEIPRQACWVHKLRNVSNYLPKKYRKECIKGARRIYLADNKKEAVRAYKAWAKKWTRIKPEAVRCVERELDELLAFLDCPKEHRIKIRTTNVIERSFREVRRRVRTMNCFTNQASCERIIYCIFNHLNNHWKGRLLKDFNLFKLNGERGTL